MSCLREMTSIEQLRNEAPGEWGNLLGLDRVPEVRCLRSKLALLSRREGQAAKWNTELAKDWMGQLPDGEMLFYINGHVRAAIRNRRPHCRVIMWRGNGCVCAPRPATGLTPWTVNRSST